MKLMAVMRIIEVLVILQIIAAVQSSHVHDAKVRLRGDVKHELDEHSRRWSSRRRSGAQFTSWTKWSKCDPLCKQVRERYCKVRRKCGTTKQFEERKCPKCRSKSHVSSHAHYFTDEYGSFPDPHRFRLPVYQEVYEAGTNNGFYSVKAPARYKKKKKPIYIDVDDYEDLEEEDESSEAGYKREQIKSIRTKNWRDFYKHYRPSYHDLSEYGDKRNLYHGYGGSVYEDEEYQESKDHPIYDTMDYGDEYDDVYPTAAGRNFDVKNSTTALGLPREKAVFDAPPRRKRVYSRWSRWTKCSSKCTTRRYKKCRMKEICGKEVLREIAYCYMEGSFCQKWLEGQVRKGPSFDVKPMATSRMDDLNTNSIASDYILSGKGYRAPEYTPMKLKCGIPSIRSGRRSTHNMLKIIGGRTARKGQWPWQVVIFNRFREAFCGGTLIAPNWVLTAAHCVRKVLYVRLGEHNLDVQDGTEVEFRVTKSIKHPNYDKKTVDSDVALLRLPKPMNNTNWIGYACMPRTFQPLPKNIQCTVIGWGKRRNNDASGTSLLHQAEVPIIPMDNCKAVYHDYTITKNMFCAGHKRGRIDTCAGDSGGPLLCRDTTKPNHPWTIFGITSFGDGCAKKNKFGIYAKVPNYVDWVWSVVNCNGNCKSNSSQHPFYQRGMVNGSY